MIEGFFRSTLRPTKFAFLVDPYDRLSIITAISASTCIWGGMYCPIIPVYKRRPPSWRTEYYEAPSPNEIIDGYLFNFDPDIIVTVNRTSVGRLYRYGIDILSINNRDGEIDITNVLMNGINIIDIAKNYAKEELRFQRLQPVDLIIPSYQERFRTFLACIFGYYPKTVRDELLGHLESLSYVIEKEIGFSDHKLILNEDMIFPIQLGNMLITRVGYLSRGSVLHVMEPTNLSDLIDYWNLRALGMNPIPIIPSDLKRLEELTSKIKYSLDNQPAGRMGGAEYSIPVYKGRSLALDEFRGSFENILQVTSTLKTSHSFSPQEYPPIWEQGEYRSVSLESKTTTISVNSSGLNLRVPLLEPEFSSNLDIDSGSFANDLTPYLYDRETLLPEVFPRNTETVNKLYGGTRIHNTWRVSREGLTCISSPGRSDISLRFAEAEDVFAAWLSSQGWKIEPSDAGRIASQMIKYLGGIYGINLLANPEVIDFLGKFEGAKSMSLHEFMSIINRITQQPNYELEPEPLIDRFVEANIVRLGLDLQCTICGRHSWHSLKEIDYKVLCPWCDEVFSLPASPNRVNRNLSWGYKAIGPFSIQGLGSGQYSVLLALRFFSTSLNGRTTSVVGFNATNGKVNLEIDFGTLIHWPKFSGYRQDRVTTIFGECKSFNLFEQKDLDRLFQISENMPDTVIALVTLRSELTEKEKRLIRKFIKKIKRTRASLAQQFLLLTSNELLTHESPPFCWESLTTNFEELDREFRHDFTSLCAITQRLYVDEK